jgi:DNA-binding CsgD family transcriptional regulator
MEIPMSRFSIADTRALRDLLHEAGTVRAGGPSLWNHLLPQIRQLIGLERICAYGVSDGEKQRLQLDYFEADGFDANPLADAFRGMLARGERRWGLYDPARPEPNQRNRAVLTHELAPRSVMEKMPLLQLFQKLGLGEQLLRVLVCDGPVLLAWVGFYSDSLEAQPRQPRLLQALVPVLKRRLLLEQQLKQARLNHAALGAALEQISGAAFVTDGAGRVLHANHPGREALDADPHGLREQLARVLAGEPGEMSVSSLEERGVPAHHLIVRRAPAGDQARVAELARYWGLTARQKAVLALLLEGHSNKAIAARLYCAERTVEAHMTAILDRAGACSRAELLARAWRRS